MLLHASMRPPTPIPSFLEEDLTPASADQARFHLISVPLEESVSYGKGTADGPRAILEASVYLESYFRGCVPGKEGIYTASATRCAGRPVRETLADAGEQCMAALKRGCLPILLGGEHTVTLGPAQAMVNHGCRFGIVHIDAHADLRNTYHGNSLSHACIMKRIMDLEIPFYQIGIRSLSYEEASLRRDCCIPHIDAEDLHRAGVDAISLPEEFPEAVYITFDVDSLDPSIMPSTGTPEPGGLSWYDAIDVLEKVLTKRWLIGADVVELAPKPGFQAPDFIAAKLVYALMYFVGSDRKVLMRKQA